MKYGWGGGEEEEEEEAVRLKRMLRSTFWLAAQIQVLICSRPLREGAVRSFTHYSNPSFSAYSNLY